MPGWTRVEMSSRRSHLASRAAPVHIGRISSNGVAGRDQAVGRHRTMLDGALEPDSLSRRIRTDEEIEFTVSRACPELDRWVSGAHAIFQQPGKRGSGCGVGGGSSRFPHPANKPALHETKALSRRRRPSTTSGSPGGPLGGYGRMP